MKTTTIRITRKTWLILNRLKQDPSEDFDEVILRLVSKNKIKKELNEDKKKSSDALN